MTENLIAKLKKEEDIRDEYVDVLDRHTGATKERILDIWWDLYKKYEPRKNERDNLYAWRLANQEFKRLYLK